MVLKNTFIVSLALLSLLGLTACSDEEALEPNPLPIVPETKVNYDAKWSVNFGQGVENQFIKLRPAESYGKVFIADAAGKVSALDPANGSVIWKSKTKNRISAGVTVANRLAVVGTREGEVVAFDVDDGAEKWKTMVSSEIIAAPAVSDGFVVVNTVDGNVVALDAESGERKWFYDRNLPALTLRGTSAPVIAHGAAIAGFANGKVGVFILETGQLAWEKQITAPSGRSDLERLVDVDAQPIVFGTTLYASSYNGNLSALELQTGEAKWSRELSSYQDMMVENQTLLVTHDNGYVSSLNRNNGSLLWTQKALFLRGSTSPVAFNDHIVVGDEGGYLHMMDKSDGSIIGQLNINQNINYSDCYDSDEVCRFHNHEQYGVAGQPLVVDDMLLVQTRNGHLIAYEQRKPDSK